jgi:hypothetical protein
MQRPKFNEVRKELHFAVIFAAEDVRGNEKSLGLCIVAAMQPGPRYKRIKKWRAVEHRSRRGVFGGTE